MIDKKTNEKILKRPKYVVQGEVVVAQLQATGIVCIESADKSSQLSRMTLRDEGKTVAIGQILKVLNPGFTSNSTAPEGNIESSNTQQEFI